MFKNSILKVSLIVITTSFILSSCASIVSKDRYPLTIDSSPSGADVTITDLNGLQVMTGKTPLNVRLKSGAGYFKKAEYQIEISNPGYEKKVIFLSANLDGWFFGNIFIGGPLGLLIIDPITGAMWSIDTRFINESLTKSRSTTSVGPEMKILDIDDIPEEMKTHLISLD